MAISKTAGKTKYADPPPIDGWEINKLCYIIERGDNYLPLVCPLCEGKGTVTIRQNGFEVTSACPVCDGKTVRTPKYEVVAAKITAITVTATYIELSYLRNSSRYIAHQWDIDHPKVRVSSGNVFRSSAEAQQACDEKHKHIEVKDIERCYPEEEERSPSSKDMFPW